MSKKRFLITAAATWAIFVGAITIIGHGFNISPAVRWGGIIAFAAFGLRDIHKQYQRAYK